MAQVTPSIQSFEWSKYVAWVCWHGSRSPDPVGDLQVLQEAQMASIVAAILHEMTQIATTRGIVLEDITFFPTKTLSQLAVDDLVTRLQQMGDRVGVAGTAAQNLDPARCRTGQTPGSRRDPGLCGTAKCCAGYSNANDGCLLQTDRRNQPLSPVNGVSALLCHIAPIDGHGMPGDKRGSIRTEPDHGFSDFLWMSHPSHGFTGNDLCSPFGIVQALVPSSAFGCSLDRHN